MTGYAGATRFDWQMVRDPRNLGRQVFRALDHRRECLGLEELKRLKQEVCRAPSTGSTELLGMATASRNQLVTALLIGGWPGFRFIPWFGELPGAIALSASACPLMDSLPFNSVCRFVTQAHRRKREDDQSRERPSDHECWDPGSWISWVSNHSEKYETWALGGLCSSKARVLQPPPRLVSKIPAECPGEAFR